jgi:DegV family protein with EDD domain
MKPICIITDSTSDIPKDIAAQYGIEIIPLTINHENKNYRDKIDISMEEILKILEEGDEIPTTSQVNPQNFYEVYSRILNEGKQIISVHISSKLSGTYQSALIAKDMLNSEDIFVIDSKGVSFGTGILAIEAAKMVKSGIAINEVVESVEQLSKKVRTIFVVDTLKYLKKGGRISHAHAAIGTLLNIKPILYIVDGRIEVYEKARSLKKALDKMQGYLEEESYNKELTFAFGNVAAHNEMMDFSAKIKELAGIKEIVYGQIGAVVACYAGPGTVGMFFFAK